MIQKVHSLLQGIGIPIEHLFRPDITGVDDMVLSYHFFNEEPEQFGDGVAVEYGGSLQVDLFVKHRVDFLYVKKQVVDLLTNNGFMFMDISTSGDFVDGAGKVTHIKFTFNYLEI